MLVMYVFTKTAMQAVQGPSADADLMHPQHRALHAFIWVTAHVPALLLMGQLCGPSIGAGGNSVQASTGQPVLPASLMACVEELKDRHGIATAMRLACHAAMAEVYLSETQSDTSHWAMGPDLLGAIAIHMAIRGQGVDAMLVAPVYNFTRKLIKFETDPWEATDAFKYLSTQEALHKQWCASQQAVGELKRFLLDTTGRHCAYLDIMVASHDAWLQESNSMAAALLNSAVDALQAGKARNVCPEESLMEPIRRTYTAKPCAHNVVPNNLMTAKLVLVALTGNDAWFEEAARLFRELPGAPVGGVDMELARIFQDLGKGRAAVVFDWAMRLSEEERKTAANMTMVSIPQLAGDQQAQAFDAMLCLRMLSPESGLSTTTSDGSPRPTYRGNWTAENPNKLLPQAIQLVESVLETMLLNQQAVAVFNLSVLADAERSVLCEAALAMLRSRLADSLDAAAAFLTEVEDMVNQAGSASGKAVAELGCPRGSAWPAIVSQ
ncbi:hypothetical protein WJX72_008736 [[Myrmecia] bisecta]|uniref:Uncharacterized protein n=1 Tax=[Myrmecia] bisecta TaxID=41462 RepID=A0AAW1QFS8_9CHLO